MSAVPHARDMTLVDRVIAHIARHGASDTSIETLARALRMSTAALLQEVGSREQLLMTLVDRLETQQQHLLADLLDAQPDPFDAGQIFWRHIAGQAPVFAPLFFELSSLAMRHHRATEPFRRRLTLGWVEVLQRGFAAAGQPPAQARRSARIAIATTRGLIFELALSGDKTAADHAMADFLQQMRTAF